MQYPPGRIITYDKVIFFRTIGYTIHSEEVRRFHESKAKLRIISAPARTSKSYSAAAEAGSAVFPRIYLAEDGKGWPIAYRPEDPTYRMWVVCPDYKLAKEYDYLYNWFVNNRDRHGWKYKIEHASNDANKGEMWLSLLWGSDIDGRPIRTRIEARSSKNERALQAEEVEYVIVSEAADNTETIWSKYLSTRYGRAIMPTTPKITGEWVRRMIDSGREDPRLSIASFNYDGRCNPRYDWHRYWIEHAKAESRQSSPKTTIWVHESLPPSPGNGHDCFAIGMQCWAARDAHFAEQFLGLWTFAQDRVLPFRLRSDGMRTAHVLDEPPAWINHADLYVAVDYGFTDPAAAGFYAVNPDRTVCLFDEIYQSGLTSDEFVRKILGRVSAKGYRIKAFYGDPKKPEVMRHYRRQQLPVIQVNKLRQTNRQVGFMIFNDYLSDDPDTGSPKFFVTRSCHNAISEFTLLRRKERRTGEEYGSTAFVGADHMVDCTRYFLTTLPMARSHEELYMRRREGMLTDLIAKAKRPHPGRLVMNARVLAAARSRVLGVQ